MFCIPLLRCTSFWDNFRARMKPGEVKRDYHWASRSMVPSQCQSNRKVFDLVLPIRDDKSENSTSLMRSASLQSLVSFVRHTAIKKLRLTSHLGTASRSLITISSLASLHKCSTSSQAKPNKSPSSPVYCALHDEQHSVSVEIRSHQLDLSSYTDTSPHFPSIVSTPTYSTLSFPEIRR